MGLQTKADVANLIKFFEDGVAGKYNLDSPVDIAPTVRSYDRLGLNDNLAQAQALFLLGCRSGQGWGFGRALPADMVLGSWLPSPVAAPYPNRLMYSSIVPLGRRS